MIKHDDGTNLDGTPRYRFELTQDEVDGGIGAFWTGPISGTIMVDGTSYDVTDDYIPVKVEHIGPLHLAIHSAHHKAGRMTDAPMPELPDVSVS